VAAILIRTTAARFLNAGLPCEVRLIDAVLLTVVSKRAVRVRFRPCLATPLLETQVVLRRTIVGTDEVVVFEDSLTHIFVSQIYREPQFGEEPRRCAAKSSTYLRPCLLGSG
jgi:hypothetical protein